MNAYELAKKVYEGREFLMQASNMLKIQADRIAELEKELKRTKFAWNMAENEIERLTPQTKPLSDFEIKGIMAQDECWIGEDCSIPDMMRFARLIEERHGIK